MSRPLKEKQSGDGETQLTASNNAERRILKDVKDAQTSKNSQIKLVPGDNEDLYHWKAFITPDSTSMYHGMVFELSVFLPPDYPYRPPKITFVTPVYHPNINTNGVICLSTLSSDWSPVLTLEKTLMCILSLLDAPNPSDPLRPDAAEVFVNNKEEYCRKCRERYVQPRNNC